MDYSNIFNYYNTSEGVPFLLLNKKIHFPEDSTLDMYDYVYVSEDTPWTILSYQIYGTIDYWWVLSALNRKKYIFYAEAGGAIKFIKREIIEDVLTFI